VVGAAVVGRPRVWEMAMKRLVGAVAFVGLTAISSAAMAQEIQLRGPLAGAPSCRHCVQYRAGRVSLAPTFGITFQDEFDRTMFAGAQLNYHFNDLIAIGAWGAYGVAHVRTNLTSQVTDRLSGNATGTPNIPAGGEFPNQIGQLNWFISAPQLTLVPLRGKLSLFQNIFIDTDFYLFGGLGIVGLTERQSAVYDASMDPTQANVPTAASLAGNQTARSSRVALTGTFGVGLNFYINRFISLQVEYRAFPFAWNTMGTDESSRANTCGPTGTSSCAGFPDYAVRPDTNGAGGGFNLDDNDRQFRWNQMVNFGLNFFLPTAPRISD